MNQLFAPGAAFFIVRFFILHPLFFILHPSFCILGHSWRLEIGAWIRPLWLQKFVL